jgi:hypothetical protein
MAAPVSFGTFLPKEKYKDAPANAGARGYKKYFRR